MGCFISGYEYNKDLKKIGKIDPSDNYAIVGFLWPVVLLFLIFYPIWKLGGLIAEIIYNFQNKRIEIKKRKLIKQQELRIELAKIEKDLDVELSSLANQTFRVSEQDRSQTKYV